jgi:hypothetical protein
LNGGAEPRLTSGGIAETEEGVSGIAETEEGVSGIAETEEGVSGIAEQNNALNDFSVNAVDVAPTLKAFATRQFANAYGVEFWKVFITRDI